MITNIKLSCIAVSFLALLIAGCSGAPLKIEVEQDGEGPLKLSFNFKDGTAWGIESLEKSVEKEDPWRTRYAAEHASFRDVFRRTGMEWETVTDEAGTVVIVGGEKYRLRFSGDEPGDEALEQLAAAVSTKDIRGIISLKLDSCVNLTADGIYALRGLIHLEDLLLLARPEADTYGPTAIFTESAMKITEEHLGHIAMMDNLTSLQIVASDITSEALSHLANMTNLKALRIEFCKNINDSGLSHLKDLKQLEYLNLFYCQKITDKGMANFAGFGQLKRLDLGFCKRISDEGIAHLSCKGLEYLDLTMCYRLTDESMAHIGQFTELKFLDVSACNRISDNGVESLSGLSGLKYLDLFGCSLVTDASIENLSKHEGLVYIDVRKTGITRKGIEQLKSSLLGCEIITDKKD